MHINYQTITMKKLPLLTALTLLSVCGFAQSNLKSIPAEGKIIFIDKDKEKESIKVNQAFDTVTITGTKVKVIVIGGKIYDVIRSVDMKVKDEETSHIHHATMLDLITTIPYGTTPL